MRLYVPHIWSKLRYKEIEPEEISKLMRNKNVVDSRNILDRERWAEAGFKVKVLGDGR